VKTGAVTVPAAAWVKDASVCAAEPVEVGTVRVPVADCVKAGRVCAAVPVTEVEVAT
jgi:hypothetical protein